MDEAAMCVVNVQSISRRLGSMGAKERTYVSKVSCHFLTNLIRLAHCPDAYKAKDAATGMLKLLLTNVFDNDSLKNKFVTYKSQQDMAKANDRGMGADASKVMSSMLGCLDPVAILSSILDDGTDAGDALSRSVNGMLSVLKGYNPLKLDDIVMLEICNGGGGCVACTSLKRILDTVNSTLGNARFPADALIFFLRCMNHRRFNFGGDMESARASHTYCQNQISPGVVTVPLRDMLLSCIFSNSQAIISGGDVPLGSDESWAETLHQQVQRLPLQERAHIAQIYAFMMFSRHRQQSGDCIKQFLYTIFARFLYSATEILFCSNENATCEVDNGNFISYIEAVTNTVVMSSTLFTMNAYLSWREGGASAAPIVNLFSGSWKKNFKTGDSLLSVGEKLGKCICEMAKQCKLGSRASPTSGLDSVRSVRQGEKYIPFGFVEHHRGTLRLLPVGVSLYARSHSTGDNIPCNCFHILPCIEGGQTLGPLGMGNQSSFEKVITPGGIETGTGKVLGLITAFIDKTVLGTSAPADPDNFERRVNKAIEDIVFTKTLIHEDSVDQTRNMPHSNFWKNPVIPTLSLQSIARCFDTRIHTLFLIWQRPNVDCPNVSALTASQLELMLSRDSKWAEFITRIFFNIERVSFQLADAIVKTMNEDNGNNGVVSNILHFVLPSHLEDPNQAQKLIDTSLNAVYRVWTAAISTDGNGAEITGAKAQYTSHLYQLLHKIVIENDMNPSTLIAFSKFLRNYVSVMDELLMKVQRCSTFQ